MPEASSLFFDARTVRPGMSGVGRYAYNILAALAAREDRPRLRAMFLAESLPLAERDAALRNVEKIAAAYSHESHPHGDLWLEYQLPKFIGADEVYHGPAFLIPGGRRLFARVVTIHDLFVFTHAWAYPKKFAIWLRWTIRRACRHASMIIVPSQAVADQIEERNLAPAEKIAVIPYAPDGTPAIWEFKEAEPGRPFDAPSPMLVTIGTLDPRKDPETARSGLVQFRERHPNLAKQLKWYWIGGAGSLPDPTPQALIDEAGKAGFETTGAIANATARAMLARATALVTCSHAEGFGIPLAEALAAATPIIASDIKVHREVAGDAALYFPVGDAGALAEAIHRLLSEEGLAKTLKDRAGARAQKFTWEKSGEATLGTYGAALQRARNR